MIGDTIRRYEIGRRDAKAGEYAPGVMPNPYAQDIYTLGYRDEIKRMEREGRLAQARLQLD